VKDCVSTFALHPIETGSRPTKCGNV